MQKENPNHIADAIKLLARAASGRPGLDAQKTWRICYNFYRLRLLVASLFLVWVGVVWADDAEFLRGIQHGNLALIGKNIDTIDNVNLTTESGKTALMVAAKVGDCALVTKLLERGANANGSNQNGGTPIMFAAISGNVVCMEALLEKGAQVNAQGSNGWGAIMVAAAKGHYGATELLLKAGADVNIKDVYLWTPLHRATFENRLEVSDLLLQQPDIDIDSLDDQGATALHHASSQGHVALAIKLIEHGARTGLQDRRGRTALNYAVEKGHDQVVLILRENRSEGEPDQGKSPDRQSENG